MSQEVYVADVQKTIWANANLMLVFVLCLIAIVIHLLDQSLLVAT